MSDDDVRKVIVMVGHDQEDHLKVLNDVVFDERMEGLSESCVGLIRHLLEPDPDKRMTSEQFLRHPWIQGLTASWTVMEKTHDGLKAYWQNKFQSAILMRAASRMGITVSGIQISEREVKKIFQRLDIKKNGVLDYEEIQSAFRDMGFTDKNIETMFLCSDLDGTGVISYDEFRALLMNKSNSGDGDISLHVQYLQDRFKTHILDKFLGPNNKGRVPQDKTKLREIFNAIDLQGKGVLDPHDIRVVLRSAGEAEDVISRIVATLDLDQNGRVSWDAFLSIMGIKNE